MNDFYAWLVFLHVVGLVGFLLAHGVSVGVAFRLGKETSPERIRALLDLSGASYSLMYPSLLVLLLTGIITGFMGSWWGSWWIWLSLLILVLIYAGMVARGSSYFTQIRKAAGAEYFERMKKQPPLPAQPPEEIAKLIQPARAMELVAIGVVGLVIILWLMMFKPF